MSKLDIWDVFGKEYEIRYKLLHDEWKRTIETENKMPEESYTCGGVRYYNLPNAEQKKLTVNVKSINPLTEQPDFETQITEFNMEVAKFLISKNTKYGNSALEPLRTFSKLSSEEQLLIRMDDKLSRIKNSEEPQKNDIIDLIGYLDLYALKKGWTDLSDLIN